MILKFDRSYSKRQWEFPASILWFMSTVECERYAIEMLDKYGQSMTTR